MGERVLTLRELNRATLARQLLLERKRLSPTAVIERLVGMQAQWPSAPYVGIWTRTTSFRREGLERLLASAAVVKATVMRQTLHLVTRRDYGLLRAALSETNFPWESALAKRLEPSARAFAADGPVTTAEALAHLEHEHGLTGLEGRRAWRAVRVRAHVLHHHETALWRARPEGRFVAVEEPEAHVPVEARAEIFRRYLAAFGPGFAPRHQRLEHDAHARDRRSAGASRAVAPLPRRARPRAPRHPSSTAAGSRDAGARSFPAEVGQRAARASPIARACSPSRIGRRSSA